jgi:type I restriction enzyme S subunit
MDFSMSIESKCTNKTTGLDDLPEGWDRKRLIDVLLSLENGTRPKGGVDNIEEGIPSIGGEHLNKEGGFILENIKFIQQEFYDNMKRGRIENGDVLVVKDGATTGKVSLVRNDYPFQESAVNEHVFICRPNKKYVLPEYLFYNLFSPLGKNKILRSFHGAAQGGINTQFANDYELPLPPLPTQRRIVSILEKAEETKRLRAQADELTDRLLQSVFLEMFGDPVRNPKGWEKSIIDAITVHHKQGFYTNSEYTETGIKLIRITDITEYGSITYDDMPRLDLDSKTIDQFKVQKGDFLFARSGVSIGRCAIVEKDIPCVFGSYIIRFRFDQNKINNKFFLFLMKLPRLQSILKNYAHGSTNPNINAENINNIAIFIPPLPLQQKFARIVEKIETMRQSQNQSKQQIEDLFSTLMQKAFRGEI